MTLYRCRRSAFRSVSAVSIRVQKLFAPESPVNETAAPKQNLLDLDRAGLEDFFADTLGEKRYRAHQVMKWIHHRHVTDSNEMTDLGKPLRAKPEAHAEVSVPQRQFEKPSTDRTHKWLLGMDRNKAIDAVLIERKTVV